MHHLGRCFMSQFIALSGGCGSGESASCVSASDATRCSWMGCRSAPPEQGVGLATRKEIWQLSFRTSFGSFGSNVLRGRISHEEIKREALAQMDHIRKAGIAPVRFDAHKLPHTALAGARATARSRLRDGHYCSAQSV